MLSNENVRVVYTNELPYSVRALTIKDEEDFYTIFLNAKFVHEQLMNSLKHELEHIKNNDFRSYDSIQHIEHVRHGI